MITALCRYQLSVSLCMSLSVCPSLLPSVALSVSASCFQQPLPSPMSPLDGSLPVSPRPSFLFFFFPPLFSCQLSSAPPPQPAHHISNPASTSSPYPTFLPLISTSSLLDTLVTPIALPAPSSTCSPAVCRVFALPVSFCVTWHCLPETPWHLSHCPFILPLSPFTN